MQLEWISLADFRSYRELEWRPTSGVNVLVGENGAGKTNLLEAVAYLATLSSLRGAPDGALVHHDAERAIVRGEVASGDGSSLIEVELPRRGGRRAFLDRQRLARTADLLGSVRVVGFLPEDLDIVKRGPAERRTFLDDLAVQLWPGSYVDQSELERALRQRNTFLRQGGRDPVTLAVWDERVAHAGARVMSRRARAATAVAPHLTDAHRQVAGSEAVLELSYRSDWGGTLDPEVPTSELASRLAAALEERHRVDEERRVTTVGPHRDDPVVLLDGHDLRYHGSQGEQRTVALGLRIASHRAVAATGPAPILLLDDVYSELDPARGEALTRALPDDTQTLVTTADPAQVPLEGRVWQVADGKVV